MKVLIADDDKVMSHLLAGRLRALRWRVDLAVHSMQTLMFAMRSAPVRKPVEPDALHEMIRTAAAR